MPFDGTTPRDFGGGHDPAPTWGERLECWAVLAILGLANASILLLIALWSLAGMALGLAGDADAAVDCAGMAVLTALVTYPMHLSRVRVRALAAGRWP